jgi:hypothetical protein
MVVRALSLAQRYTPFTWLAPRDASVRALQLLRCTGFLMVGTRTCPQCLGPSGSLTTEASSPQPPSRLRGFPHPPVRPPHQGGGLCEVLMNSTCRMPLDKYVKERGTQISATYYFTSYPLIR